MMIMIMEIKKMAIASKTCTKFSILALKCRYFASWHSKIHGLCLAIKNFEQVLGEAIC